MTATRRNASSRRRCSPLAPRWRAGSSSSAAALASSSSALSFAARAEARVGRSLLRRVCVTVAVLVTLLVVVGWGAGRLRGVGKAASGCVWRSPRCAAASRGASPRRASTRCASPSQPKGEISGDIGRDWEIWGEITNLRARCGEASPCAGLVVGQGPGLRSTSQDNAPHGIETARPRAGWAGGAGWVGPPLCGQRRRTASGSTPAAWRRPTARAESGETPILYRYPVSATSTRARDSTAPLARRQNVSGRCRGVLVASLLAAAPTPLRGTIEARARVCVGGER